MSEKKLNARIVHKHDTEANWLKATSFIPKQGEIIVYDIDANYNHERLKIGDGETNVNDLPFYACSWNDLTDVPFGGYGDVVLTWDRNIKNEEHHIVTLNMGSDNSGDLHKRGYYCVSNSTPSNEVLVEGYNITFGSYEYPFNYNKWFETENEISSFNDNYTSVCNDTIVVVKKDNTAIVTIDGTVTFPKSGIYFFYEERRSSSDEYSWYISELKFKSEVKTLDEHLIPSTIARVSDIDEVKALVGDTSVSEQINDALASKSDSNHNHNDTYYTKNEVDEDFQDKIYKQNEAPTDAEEGALWLDMDEETIVGGGMNGITVDSTLSSTSTNPVQNKVVNAAINNLNTLVGDKSVSVQINEALTKFSGGGNVAQNTIIDVISLPTENINKSVLYRVLKGTLVYDSNVLETSCFVVDGLPETGEPVTTDGQSINAAYYNVADNDVYGYLTAEVAAMAGVPSGWYPFATLAPVFNVGWMGVIGDIMDSETDDESYALLLEGDLWYYTYDWKLLGPIGSAGTGIMAETFNHPGNVASGMYAHAEGRKTVASDLTSHAEGHTTTASGGCSHAEGSSTTASGDWSHAEGADTTASGLASHAEGVRTTASSEYSHAEGYHTTASGYASHAEGGSTTASEPYSHAEGNGTTASGFASHAEGEGTIASSNYQHVQGICNIEDSNNKYLHIVGNGSNVDILKYSNAHTLDWDGNGWFAGDVYVGSTSGTNRDSGSKKLVTDNELRSYAQPIGDYVLVEHVEPLVPKNAAPGNVVIVEGVYDDSTIASSFSSIDLFEEKYSAASTVLAERTFSNDDIMVDGLDSVFSVREYVPNFIVGETYIVLWNDETYVCEAYNNGDVVCIGNGINEPFVFMRVPDVYLTEIGAYLICAPFTDLGVDGTYTVSIFDSSTEYKIKDEYLPENIDLPDYAKTSDLDSKMSSENPVGTGSFSMNRKPDTTIGDYSHAEGYNTTASGNASHAEGNKTIASGTHSHAEGFNTTADGFYSHAEGYNTTTGSTCSHAEGYGTTASGSHSHAEGYNTTAKIHASHAEGGYTIASSNYQHVQGICNIEDANNKYAHIVGNGSKNEDIVTRSNAHTLDWDGNAWFAGKIKVGGTGYDDASAAEVVLKSDLANIDGAVIVDDILSSTSTNPVQNKVINAAISNLNTLVGGKAVSEQIEDAIANSGGSSVPSDWEAKEGEPGHILNRPFYSEYDYSTLLPTTTLEASGSFGGVDGVGFLTKLLDVRDRAKYVVTYNGVEYKCRARATTFNDIPCCILGNSAAFGDPNTGEPFLVCAFSEEVAAQVGVYGGVIPMDNYAQAPRSAPPSFSISVRNDTETTVTIPKKYIPKMFHVVKLPAMDASGQSPTAYIDDPENEILQALLDHVPVYIDFSLVRGTAQNPGPFIQSLVTGYWTIYPEDSISYAIELGYAIPIQLRAYEIVNNCDWTVWVNANEEA